VSAVPPPAVPPIPGPAAGRPRDPGTPALVLAIVAAVLAMASSPIGIALQISLGTGASWVALLVGAPVLILGVIALVLGLVALSRGGGRRAVAGAGAGLGGFLAAGQLVGLLTALALSVVH
jgi:hypothetical protein